MKVLKFGGTSVGSAARIKHVADLITKGGRKIVVLSAMSGTTNALVEISNNYRNGNNSAAEEIITSLEAKYAAVIDELLSTECAKQKASAVVAKSFEAIRRSNNPVTSREEKQILAQGELISTALMHCFLEENGYKSALIPALDFMRTRENGEPDMEYIASRLSTMVERESNADIIVTQGFICRNSKGEIDNLQRGGSDYTATIIGAALNLDEIQIWTDIDGMHNNDPRFVEGTHPVSNLHFEEASELAYFGAKILHPLCVLPAKDRNIPVRLLNTMDPEAHGTLIHTTTPDCKLKAVAAKDNITAISIKSNRTFPAYEFLRKVFEIFEKHHTPIDMMASSEVGLTAGIDNDSQLDAIAEELKDFATVSIDKDMVIICVAGDFRWEQCSFQANILQALNGIPVRLISYGSSNYSISVLVRASDKITALKALEPVR